MIYQETFDKIAELNKDTYEDCVFKNCDFSNQYLNGFVFENCEFQNCNLSNANVQGTSFQNVTFVECKLLGIHFHKANPFSFEVHFQNAQLDFSSFYQCNLKQSSFDTCSLNQVDFTESNLTGVNFNACNLLNAVFFQTNLEKTNFTSAINYSIHPNENRLKKAVFSEDGLKGLLTFFDIVIK